MPLLVLSLAETGLRLAGLGGYPPVILEVGADGGGSRWYSTHRPGTDSFFYAGRSLTGGMREIHFTTPKPPNTIRICLLGGSAVQGFPQPLPLTNGSFLEAMLREAWEGERNVQVLNFGATAVASFPVSRFLDEVLEHEPDLVVVMTGNNEFYGAYGVSSLHTAGRSPTGMRFRRWVRGLAITQALAALLPERFVPEGKLMEQVAVTHRIPPEDRIRRAAAVSLRTHLSAMARRCREREVPLFLCTIPTNERSLFPIGDDGALSPDLGEKIARAEELRGSSPARAADLARSAIAIENTRAGAHFVLARSLTALGRHEAALEAYVRARDLDTMPWRAPSFAREAVLAAVAQGAVLCDLESAFRAESPGGAIGDELMDDHVHFSLAGQALFAKTIARLMSTTGGPLHVRPEALDALPGWETYAERLGRSVYTDHVAATRIRSLFRIPFMRRNNPDAARRADDLCRRQLESMNELDRVAVETWRDPDLHGATDRPLTFVVGVYRMREGDYGAAEPLFHVARATLPAVSLWRLEATWNLLDCRRRRLSQPTSTDLQLCREAIAIGELLSRFGADENADVLRYLGLAYNLAGNHAQAIRCLEGFRLSAGGADDAWRVVAVLVDSYLQLGQSESARQLLRQAAREPSMAEAARRRLLSLESDSPPAAP